MRVFGAFENVLEQIISSFQSVFHQFSISFILPFYQKHPRLCRLCCNFPLKVELLFIKKPKEHGGRWYGFIFCTPAMYFFCTKTRIVRIENVSIWCIWECVGADHFLSVSEIASQINCITTRPPIPKFSSKCKQGENPKIPSLILDFNSWQHISCYNCMARTLYGQLLPLA